MHAHTRLLTRAIEWNANGKNNSFVLRGDDLRSAERWLGEANAQKERQATLFGDAANALLRAGDEPVRSRQWDDVASRKAMSAHVEHVEQILGAEQAQRGQLVGEIKSVVVAQQTRAAQTPSGP